VAVVLALEALVAEDRAVEDRAAAGGPVDLARRWKR